MKLCQCRYAKEHSVSADGLCNAIVTCILHICMTISNLKRRMEIEWFNITINAFKWSTRPILQMASDTHVFLYEVIWGDAFSERSVVTSLQVKMKSGVIKQRILHFHLTSLEKKTEMFKRCSTTGHLRALLVTRSHRLHPQVFWYDSDGGELRTQTHADICHLTGASPGHSYTVKSPSSVSSSEVAPESGILHSFLCLKEWQPANEKHASSLRNYHASSKYVFRFVNKTTFWGANLSRNASCTGRCVPSMRSKWWELYADYSLEWHHLLLLKMKVVHLGTLSKCLISRLERNESMWANDHKGKSLCMCVYVNMLHSPWHHRKNETLSTQKQDNQPSGPDGFLSAFWKEKQNEINIM